MLNWLVLRSLQTSVCLLLVIVLTVGCEEKSPLQIPVPESDVDISIERLDQSLFTLTPVSFRKQHPDWQLRYPEMYRRYIEDILALGELEDSLLFEEIRAFTTNETIADVKKTTTETFPNLDQLEEELTIAWSYYQYYFPDRPIPNHISFIGGFNTPALLTENGIGIGLDMFLGSEVEYYKLLQIPVYMRHRMRPEYVAPTILKGWLETELYDLTSGGTLLDEIIARGKILYCMDAVFPNMSDDMKIGYTPAQISWAKAHERNVWAHFIDKELLFSSNASEIAKFTNEGPFTVDLVKDSPARMGNYVGWQIVRAYMATQSTIDLNKLIQTDAKTILNTSKYKP